MRVVSSRRSPLTGRVCIEWVDAADPEDDAAEPNFGWSLTASESLRDHARLTRLLREVADSVDELD